MVYVNRWLGSQGISTRSLACDYDGECIFLVVTHKKVDPNEFEPFHENQRSRKIKEQLKMDDLVTVANPYGK
jgi:hypothetical protein